MKRPIPKIMNKTQLVDAIAADANITKIEARKAVDAFVRTATKALSEGDKISLSGFGSFSVVQMSARMGRNPRTGMPVKIAPRRVVKFRPTLDLDME